MRQLTFEGFMKKYIRELSYCNSNSFHKLLKESELHNPRLRELLMLYAYLSLDKSKLHKMFSNYNWFQKDSAYFENYLNPTLLISDLKNEDSNIPIEYKKVYKTYLTLRDRSLNDMHTKELMLKKIIRLQVKKEVSTYRLYTDLNLNPGNLNDFVKNNRLDKISLKNSKRILNYLEDFHSEKVIQKNDINQSNQL